ncbi:MAG: radical SAM family heme chaperone HemW [Woeseiaceae bacterium]|nr:radical SAM family heme chaperone HemW [Woeseiaceae bacterium]
MIAPPLSLYVHLPWCVRKCPYCDFNSHSAPDGAPTSRYVEALLRDLESEAHRANGRKVETVFLGGGTPSLFSPREVATILDGVNAHFSLPEDAEITMEANPGTVEFDSPRAYRDAGINRLSLGAQSFDDAMLGRLGRIHSSDDIARTYAQAVEGGFDNINIDLMHGLPGQTIVGAQSDLRAAIELGPAHISWYQLTLEPNTVFHARPPEDLPDEETAWAIQEAGADLLAAGGYEQYEVSAWAKDRRQCRHNVNYWLFGDYLAVGAGAHGKTTSDVGVIRYHKPLNPLQYMLAIEAGESGAGSRPLDESDLVFEFMLGALRLVDGFDERLFAARTSLGTGALAGAAREALAKGLVERLDDGVWRPTLLGRRFLNDLQAGFLR